MLSPVSVISIVSESKFVNNEPLPAYIPLATMFPEPFNVKLPLSLYIWYLHF